MIIRAGEKASAEWREKKNARKRGTVAKAKLAAANADFTAFLEGGIDLRADVKTRAYVVYGVYLEWMRREGRGAPMSMRAFGLQVRKRFTVKKGAGGVISYVGMVPKKPVTEEKVGGAWKISGGI